MLGFQAGPWSQRPSADSAELASLSTGQRPEEAVSIRPAQGASLLRRHCQSTVPPPSPSLGGSPRPSPQGRQRETERQTVSEATSPRGKLPGTQQQQPGSPVVSSPTQRGGQGSCLTNVWIIHWPRGCQPAVSALSPSKPVHPLPLRISPTSCRARPLGHPTGLGVPRPPAVWPVEDRHGERLALALGAGSGPLSTELQGPGQPARSGTVRFHSH